MNIRGNGLAIIMLTVSLAWPIGANAQSARSSPYDRSGYLSPDTRTSDDPRRIPSGPERNVERDIVIKNARLFDGTGAPARPATIVIHARHISAILAPDDQRLPPDANVIDAAGRTVMPGLIDLHVHLTYVNSTPTPLELGAESQADSALRGVERLRYFLESGITSVRDVASHGMAPFRLKVWVADGRIPGPRIYAAGQLITSKGGHGSENYFQPTAPGYPDAAVREASGPDDWREAVREQFKKGADLIKVGSHFSPGEIGAAVDEAHRLGLRVTCDCETIFTEIAVQAGVDGIEHPLPRTDATIREMAVRKVASVPTLVSYQYLIASLGGYWGSTSRRFTLTNDSNFAMARKLKAAGVKLGIGTDLVIDWHQSLPGAYIAELHNFESLGYSPSQALETATRTNAEILGMDDRLGTLTPGKLADLIIVDGKPDANLDDLRNLDTVIIDGRVEFRNGGLFLPKHTEKAAPTAAVRP